MQQFYQFYLFLILMVFANLLRILLFKYVQNKVFEGKKLELVWLYQGRQALLALCFGLSWSWFENRLLLFALLLHVEKSTQWCGSISSCANVPGKELARKSCPKSRSQATTA